MFFDNWNLYFIGAYVSLLRCRRNYGRAGKLYKVI